MLRAQGITRIMLIVMTLTAIVPSTTVIMTRATTTPATMM